MRFPRDKPLHTTNREMRLSREAIVSLLSFWLPILIFFVAQPPISVAASSSIQIATFQCDITPPLGQPIGMGFIKVLETVEHPLLAKGVVIVNQAEDQRQVFVLCGLDLMEVHNSSYDFLREQIAAAAGTTPSRVAPHCLHQHTAPAFSADVHRIRLDEHNPRRLATEKYWDATAMAISAAVKEAMGKLKPLTHIGTSQAMVDRVASNRRIEQPDGSIRMRGSSCRDASLRAAPGGLIDPWLKTVSWYSGKAAVAQMHYYATHPQSFYNDQRASYDTCGIARQRLEQATGVFQLYFTGCGGDVAMGKYNDGSPEARAELTNRLHDAMQRSAMDVTRQAIQRMRWDVEPLLFPPRTEPEFSLESSRSKLQENLVSPTNIAFIRRMQAGRAVELSCLTVNNIQILHLPGEPFVLYQLAAQQSRPTSFVATAGYGDGGVGYIGSDRMYTDRGGYEQTYAFSGPCEELLIEAIGKLLARGGSP